MKSQNYIRNLFSKERILLFAILVATFISYFQIVNYEFIKWDDDTQITENKNVKNFDLQSVNYNLHQERYTFITLTTFSAVYSIWGNNPIPFHLLSLIFHLLNIIIVFLLVKKLLNNINVIFLVTILFALHPLRVESVAWISEFKDLLFTFFSLISFLLYVKYLQTCKLRFLFLTSLFVLFSSFSKIQGLFVPISFLLFDFYFNRRFSLFLILEKILMLFAVFFVFQVKTYIILSLIFIVSYAFKARLKKIKLNNKQLKYVLFVFISILVAYTLFILINNKAGLWSNDKNAQNYFSIIERFLLAGYALWFYLSNFILPFNLNAVHPYPIRLINGNLPSDYNFTLFVLLIVILLSVFMLIKNKKIHPLIFFGWFFFLLNISMVLHFIPIEGRLVVADRYTYLAYFGLFVLSASLTETYLMVYLKRYKIILFFILLIVLSIYTYNRCMVWKNTKTLFSDVINKNPKVSFAYLNLATIYLNQQNIDSAMFCYNNSIKFDSIEPTAYFNRAFAFDMIGKNDKAINDFNKALKLDKKNIYKALIYTYIGESYRKSGNNTFAIKYYNLSLKEDSLLALAYDNRGTYFLNNNMLDNAKKDFLKAIEIDKFNFSALNNFGWVLTLQGKYIEALEYYNKSLNINSNYAFAYNNRGYTEFYMGNITFAIFDYNKAIQLNPYFTQAYLNRGWAYASLKNYKGAIDDFTFVLKIEKNNQLARNNRAYAYFYTNDYKSAAEDFKTNVDNFPNSALSWQNIAWYHLQVKDYENSISEFNKSIELDNTLINSYINIGWIWLEKNNYKNSENYFKKALVINPQNIDALYFLGEVYRKSNKNDLACDYYNKSSELGNNQAKQAIEKYCKK